VLILIQDESKLSHCFRVHVLRTLLPTLPLIFACFLAVFRGLYRTVPLVREICGPIRVLFSQFLELHDLAEYDTSLRNVPAAWKRQASLSLTALQSFAWLASLAYQLDRQPNSADSWLVAVNVVTWVGAKCIGGAALWSTDSILSVHVFAHTVYPGLQNCTIPPHCLLLHARIVGCSRPDI
jgi:hypothetical protein